MTKTLLILVLCFVTTAARAQFAARASYTDSSTVDIKLGLGPSFLATGEILIVKLEAEITRKWNRWLSNSIALSGGYGDVRFYDKYAYAHQTAFTTQVDGNLFLSPLGNNKYNNLKIGTGFSLMYVSENYPVPNIYLPPEKRFSVGYSLILENEISLPRKYLLGVKAILQPYLNGDITTSVILKAGRKL